MSRSVLYLAYFFPPRGGAAVQRSLKFAKYLPQFGWRPLVVANGGAIEDKTLKVRVKLAIYEGYYHELFNEPEKQELFERATAWLSQRVSESAV